MVLDQTQSLTDEQVVERVLTGETSLYELLMRRYNQRLFRISRSVLRDDAEAEDVLQQSWVNAYQHLGQFAGRAKFATWVTKIALYEALARVRQKQRFQAAEDGPEEGRNMENFESPAADPEATAIRGEIRGLLENAVERLPEMYRPVFMLRDVEQLSTAETAQCLGLSEEAVKTRLHRSRALLRRDLAHRLGTASKEIYPFLGARCDRIVERVMAQIDAKWPAAGA